MKDYLSSSDIANSVRMKKTQFAGSIVIVEGCTDVRFYKKFVDDNDCILEPGYNKDNVIKSVGRLKDEDGILGIIDADYLNLEDEQIEEDNIFSTDMHDIETMIISSPALEDFLYEYTDDQKLNIFLKSKGRDNIREVLLECTLYIGYAKWVALKNDLSLKFKGLTFEKFITKMLSLDKSKFLNRLIANSKNFKGDKLDMTKKIEKLKNQEHDRLQICCGHDLSSVLLIGLKTKFGLYTVSSLKGVGHLEGALRMCYESYYFKETNLYRNIREWEKENSDYKVLDQKKFNYNSTEEKEDVV